MHRHIFMLLAALLLVPAPGTRGAAPDEKEKEAKQAFEGRELFLKLQCIKCHSGAKSEKAPNLEGLFGKKEKLKGGKTVTVDEGYIVESIRKPRAKVVDGWEPIMPAFDKDNVTEEDLKALVAFIKSLKKGGLGDKEPKKEPPPSKK